MELESLRLTLTSKMAALKQQEATLEEKISSDENKQKELITNFKGEVNSAISSLSQIPATFSSSSEQIAAVFKLASDLSFRIKEIDSAISRCDEAAIRAKNFSDLSECLDSIDSAISEKNVQKSCALIHRLRQIPPSILSSDQTNKMKQSLSQTLNLLHNQFQSESSPELVFQYFADCGAEAEGVKEFANMQHQQVVATTNEDYMAVSQSLASTTNDDKQAPHINLFVKLLNEIASRVTASAPTFTNPGQFAVFVRLLFDLNDQRISKVLELYSTFRNIDKLSGSTLPPSVLSYVDLVNSEIAIFAAQFSLFEKFMREKLRGGVSNAFFTSYQFANATASNGLPQNSSSSRSVKLLLTQFVIFTQSYLANVTGVYLTTIKGLQDRQKVAEAIDDLFFVLHRTLTRSLSTHHAPTACTIFNIISGIIRDGLIPEMLKQGGIRQSSDIQGKASILMNSLEMIGVYLKKLLTVIDTSVGKQFTGDELSAIQGGLTELRNELAQLSQKLSSLFNEMGRIVFPLCERLCKAFDDPKWCQVPNAIVSIEVETHLEEAFTQIYQKDFGPYETALNQANLTTFKGKLAATFAPKFEGLVFSRRVNINGAKLLANVIKWLTDFFGSQTAFTKLQQISNLLCLPDQQSLDQNWGRTDDWKLAQTDLIKIIAMRVDWAKK